MSDKLEALSQPVGLVTNQLDGAVIVESDQLLPGDNVYSQEYVTSLLAALEEKDREIDKLKSQRETLKDSVRNWMSEAFTSGERAEAAEQKYRDELAKRLIDEVVDADPQQVMAKGRIREISKGADVIIGEKVLLAKTALYYIERNRDSVEAFQKTGLSLIAQQERNAELEQRLQQFRIVGHVDNEGGEYTENYGELTESVAIGEKLYSADTLPNLELLMRKVEE